jgi:hypothetical protein
LQERSSRRRATAQGVSGEQTELDRTAAGERRRCRSGSRRRVAARQWSPCRRHGAPPQDVLWRPPPLPAMSTCVCIPSSAHAIGHGYGMNVHRQVTRYGHTPLNVSTSLQSLVPLWMHTTMSFCSSFVVVS